MKTASERMRERMRTPRVMTTISLKLAESVVRDLEEIAPMLEFSGYHSLIQAYVSQGLRRDLEKLEGSNVAAFTESLCKRGVANKVIAESVKDAGLKPIRLA